MKYIITVIILTTVTQVALAEKRETCRFWPGWFKPACQQLYRTWTDGDNELYVPAYAWHNRYTYTEAKVKTYNEFPLGAGLGKSFYDEDGDWNGLYAMAFLDSHSNVEPVIGYAFLKTKHFANVSHIGLGYTILVTSRRDIFNSIPFPGILPWASIGYRRISLAGTYIPGSRGAGNVLFLVARWLL